MNNFDGIEWIDITQFFDDPEARGHFLGDETLTFLGTDNYQGLMVDFEDFPEKGQAGYLTLLHELSADLHTKGKKLYVAVPSHNDEWNYREVSSLADGVVLMNYDEHYPGGEPGPVASQDWFLKNLQFAKRSYRRTNSSAPLEISATTGPRNQSGANFPRTRKTKIRRSRMPGSQLVTPTPT